MSFAPLVCLCFPLSGEELFHVDSGTAASCSSHDGLTVMRVGDIAGSKHTFNVSRGVVAREFDVALLVQINLTAQEFGIGTVANGEEEAVDGDVEQFLLVGTGFRSFRYP